VKGPDPARQPDQTDSDDALVDRARRSDQDACRLLVERYHSRVIGLVWGLVGDRASAEDVAQEAFFRAFMGLKGFKGRSSFRTWLFQIAINAARTHRQSRQKRFEVSSGGSLDLDVHTNSADEDARFLARDEVQRAMATLPAELREAVLLRDVNGLDYREIAVVLEVPIGTVESRIFRGRARLRRALAPPAGEGARS
jgi:RNA polymerase sigma-70 factor (ECF subfamily)